MNEPLMLYFCLNSASPTHMVFCKATLHVLSTRVADVCNWLRAGRLWSCFNVGALRSPRL